MAEANVRVVQLIIIAICMLAELQTPSLEIPEYFEAEPGEALGGSWEGRQQ